MCGKPKNSAKLHALAHIFQMQPIIAYDVGILGYVFKASVTVVNRHNVALRLKYGPTLISGIFQCILKQSGSRVRWDWEICVILVNLGFFTIVINLQTIALHGSTHVHCIFLCINYMYK